MTKRYLLAAAAVALIATPAALSTTAYADDDSTQSAAASRDSIVASARLTAAGVKLVAGVAFAPVRRTLRDSDRAARAVDESGQVIADSGHTSGGLDVSPETVQAQPAPNVPYDTPKQNDDGDNRGFDHTPAGGH